MRKIITLAVILTTSAMLHSAFAAEPVMPAPLPGPYQQFVVSTPKTSRTGQFVGQSVQRQPVQQPQPYWMQAPRQQLPYWMQAPQAPVANTAPSNQNGVTANTQTRAQMQNGFGFNAQAQAQAQTNNTFRQGYGAGTNPGYFPGYSAAPQQTQNNQPTANAGNVAPRQAIQNRNSYPTAPYPNQPNWNGPWGAPNNGQWGQSYPNWGGMPFWWQP